LTRVVKDYKNEILTAQESIVLQEFEIKNKITPFNFFYKRENARFLLDKPRYESAIGIENIGKITDVKGDGNCGYHALVLGSYAQNVTHETNFLNEDDPSMALRKQLFDHAQKPGVMSCLLQNKILFNNTGLESIPINLDQRLHTAICDAPKHNQEDKKRQILCKKQVLTINPEREDADNFGVNNLGQLIYGIKPNEDISKSAPPQYQMDPYLHLALFADMTKSRVVLNHLQVPSNARGSRQPEFYESLVYDGRKNNLNVDKRSVGGFVDNDDVNTINLVFDREHYMFVNRNYAKIPITDLEPNETHQG